MYLDLERTFELLLSNINKRKAIKIAETLSNYSIPVRLNFPPGETDLNDMDENNIEHFIQSAQQYDYKLKLQLKLGNYKL